ncbi:RNA polymerase sigma-70 factor [Carboxylicivirga sp. N1Y90]|uniref:RNA polymerase sigma-70 factor n=1 Tax=Carboxylicivirga fragile TaxID=3417571 RepID=UPI003D3539E2|nr:RNA polymerase sigma-70 factor [Marinilabiliaceae bacterium N1Y90]
MHMNSGVITQLQKGSKTAFKLLYDEYYEMLLYVCLQYISNREDAKEVVQDAFIKLWVNRANVNESANIRNFLYTIAKNNCLNILKKQEVVALGTDELLGREIHHQYEAMHRLSFDSIEFKELQEKIDEAIQKLPEHSRVVFKLSRFDHLKNKEIALKLNVTEKTVEAHMTKAIKLLKSELSPYLSLTLFFTDFFS